MQPLKTPLIIPVEGQAREFDAKLLLACVAAERNFPVILGSRTHIHYRIASLPRGIYFAKSMRSLSEKIFSILHNLGHEIVAWDEEALVHPPPDYYYGRRISPKALGMVSTLFAWGQENADLFRDAPGYRGADIHITGNPRFDLLRPELRDFYAQEAGELRDRFGDFILINTNFGAVNHYYSNLSSLKPAAKTMKIAPGGDFTAGFAQHRHEIFSSFVKLIPILAEAFPAQTLIVRPHPVENHEPWLNAAKNCANVQVVHEGSVLPWLMAAKALIQNSCTTGVEAYLLGVPSVAYQPLQSQRFDRHLPNDVSHHASDFEALCTTLNAILGDELGPCGASVRPRIEHFVSAMEGSLASDRIIDVLERSEATSLGPDRPPAIQFAKGWLTGHLRAIEKKLKGQLPNHRNSPDFFRHRFPGITLDELNARISRFEKLLSRFHKIKASQVSDHIFKIMPR